MSAFVPFIDLTILTAEGLNTALSAVEGVGDIANTAAASATADAQAATTAAAAATAAVTTLTAAVASSGGGPNAGLTPPLAADFTYWFRKAEPASCTSAVSPGGPSVLVDYPGEGMLIDYQCRTNDLWSERFVGMACPSTPHELIVAVQPADVGHVPWWKSGPGYFRADNLYGICSRYVIGRDEPYCFAEAAQLMYPSDQASNTPWITATGVQGTVGVGIGSWTRGQFLQRVYHRLVFDAAGFLTIFMSPISKTGPWRLLYQGPMDSCLGHYGTGNTPDYVGIMVCGLQEDAQPIRQSALVSHWDLHPYTGPNQPLT